MSFKFEFKIDYNQLNKLLDAFLKRHADELLGAVIAPSMVLKAGEDVSDLQKQEKTEQPPPGASSTVDNIPEDPFENLFSNPNNTTRYKDRKQ